MFALAYPMIDEDLTPQPIKDRCLKAVATIANKNNGKEILSKLGGEELLAKGVELNKNQRGMHRKEDERVNTEILLGLLVKLLAYLSFMEAYGFDRPLTLTKFGKSMPKVMQEYQKDYRKIRIKQGYFYNVDLGDVAKEWLPAVPERRDL